MNFIQSGGLRLAYDALDGKSPRIIFCAGFNSNRAGNKGLALQQWCGERQYAFTRFDYSAHGDSEGEFASCTISTWLNDLLAVIDYFNEPVLLVGSSMGGWLALLATLQRPAMVKGLLLIACAADMTRAYPDRLEGLVQQEDSLGRAFFEVENQYDNQEPYRIYQSLIDDGEQHYLLNGKIDINVPVRLIHGLADDVIEWQRSVVIAQQLNTDDVEIHFLKGSDHRLSEPSELEQICGLVEKLLARLA